MIITKTPLRMSYVGGGSDLPSYYLKYGGAVISSAIKKYVYVITKPRFEDGIRLSYSVTEDVKSKSDIQHPIVRKALSLLDIHDNIEIVSIADIPSSGTGLGSSSSFSVGLIKALKGYKGQSIKDIDLAEMACKLEIELCKNPIGKQDQYAAAFGGLKVYKFNLDNTVSVESVLCNADTINQLNNETISFYVGGKRDANSILKQQAKDLNEENKAKGMAKMVDLVWELKSELESQSTLNFGSILHENWLIKKELSNSISNNMINEIYTEAIACGSTGGKLLGAGGGGFMIFHAPSEKIKTKLLKQFYKLKNVSLDISASGSSTIFYQ
ncbi:GHMP kinase [Gammaproteobacteria bacterium]|nr:GHMP kinase [Gammaproteobacteria bacterium]